MNSTRLATRILLLLTAFSITSVFAQASELDQAVREHMNRVRDYNDRKTVLEKWERDRMRGAQLTAEMRRKAQDESERIRKAFAKTRKKEDPLAEEKREAIYQAEIERREREKAKTEKIFASQQERIRHALARLPQINQMSEYGLDTEEAGK